MLTCAQVGKGYAALGRFTCHHCIAAMTVESGGVSDEFLDLCLATMFLEMTQGAEATAGSWAEFARLEQEYASGLGMALTGGKLMLPHSSTWAFKNFPTVVQPRASSFELLKRPPRCSAVLFTAFAYNDSGSVRVQAFSKCDFCCRFKLQKL